MHGRGNNKIFSLRHRVQTSSGAHTASYPNGPLDSCPGGKAAEAWRWPLNSIYCHLHVHSPSGAWCLINQEIRLHGVCFVKHRDFTFYFHILIVPSHLRLGLSSSLYPLDFPSKILYTCAHLSCMLHAPPISPQHAVFSSLPLVPFFYDQIFSLAPCSQTYSIYVHS